MKSFKFPCKFQYSCPIVCYVRHVFSMHALNFLKINTTRGKLGQQNHKFWAAKGNLGHLGYFYLLNRAYWDKPGLTTSWPSLDPCFEWKHLEIDLWLQFKYASARSSVYQSAFESKVILHTLLCTGLCTTFIQFVGGQFFGPWPPL